MFSCCCSLEVGSALELTTFWHADGDAITRTAQCNKYLQIVPILSIFYTRYRYILQSSLAEMLAAKSVYLLPCKLRPSSFKLGISSVASAARARRRRLSAASSLLELGLAATEATLHVRNQLCTHQNLSNREDELGWALLLRQNFPRPSIPTMELRFIGHFR